MVTKKLYKKARVGIKVLREQGLLGFLITLLQFIQKYTKKQKKHEIYTKATYKDIYAADLSKPPKKWPGTEKTKLTFNWLMPPPGKGSGGHHNIFRFIKYLEGSGHNCRIYLYSPENRATIGEVRAIMGTSFPDIKAEMHWLREGDKMAEADGIFATSWETAYPSYNSQTDAKRFYFVQDFEPFFYPPGSLYTFAENTYKFGFYGITAGKWLTAKLSGSYGMGADYYDFGSDSKVYSFNNKARRNEILFYARPYTQRRGFEIGVMALDIFHQKHPEITINFAGYDISDYEIAFPYKNLKTLEVGELNSLYNSCAAGLVLSYTNMSLLPLELLACGTIPVVNAGDNNHLVSNNKYIAYADNDPHSIARELIEIIEMNNLPKYSLAASKSVSENTWSSAGKKFVEIVEREVHNHD